MISTIACIGEKSVLATRLRLKLQLCEFGPRKAANLVFHVLVYWFPTPPTYLLLQLLSGAGERGILCWAVRKRRVNRLESVK